MGVEVEVVAGALEDDVRVVIVLAALLLQKKRQKYSTKKDNKWPKGQ